METDKFENSLLTIRGRRPLEQSYDTADSCNGITEEKMNSRIDRLWKNHDSQKKEQSNKGPFIVLGLIFMAALVAMCFVYGSFPKLRAEDRERIKLPKSVEDAKGLGRALSNYTDDYFTQVLLGFIVTYIFLQTFAIPGSIFLSILSGFLFPFPLALFLVCLCSSVGASFCYLLFYLVGRKLVRHYIPDKVDRWCEQVSRHQDNLLSYIIFLRITPFLPNWFINVTSPVIDVPLFHFFLGTFIGVAPPSFGFISAGVELYVLTTTGDVMSIKSIMIVVVSALLSLAPVIFKRQLKNKIE